LIDQTNRLLTRTIARLANFASSHECPVYRLGDATARPDQLPRALYVEAARREQHGDREICDLRLHLRTSTRVDPSLLVLDELQAALENELDTVLDGTGVVPGSVTQSISDDFHVRTLSFSVFIIGELPTI